MMCQCGGDAFFDVFGNPSVGTCGVPAVVMKKEFGELWCGRLVWKVEDDNVKV